MRHPYDDRLWALQPSQHFRRTLWPTGLFGALGFHRGGNDRGTTFLSDESEIDHVSSPVGSFKLPKWHLEYETYSGCTAAAPSVS